jgi:hypothetical protein
MTQVLGINRVHTTFGFRKPKLTFFISKVSVVSAPQFEAECGGNIFVFSCQQFSGYIKIASGVEVT